MLSLQLICRWLLVPATISCAKGSFGLQWSISTSNLAFKLNLRVSGEKQRQHIVKLALFCTPNLQACKVLCGALQGHVLVPTPVTVIALSPLAWSYSCGCGCRYSSLLSSRCSSTLRAGPTQQPISYLLAPCTALAQRIFNSMSMKHDHIWAYARYSMTVLLLCLVYTCTCRLLLLTTNTSYAIITTSWQSVLTMSIVLHHLHVSLSSSARVLLPVLKASCSKQTIMVKLNIQKCRLIKYNGDCCSHK